jgi:hypothetical protein
MPKERNRTSERRALTADQAHALLAAVRGDRFECAFVLMVALGLRRGEVLGLQWDGVDWYALPKPILHVRHALRRERDPLELEPSCLVLGDVKGRGCRFAIPVAMERAGGLPRMAVKPREINPNGRSLEPIAYRIEDVELITGLSRSLIYDEVDAGHLVRTLVQDRNNRPHRREGWQDHL